MRTYKFIDMQGNDMNVRRLVDKPLAENFDMYSLLWFPNHERPDQLSLKGDVIFDNGRPWIELQETGNRCEDLTCPCYR